MERGELHLTDTEAATPPMDREAARQEARILIDVYREALRPFSERVHLPKSLRDMVKDFQRFRAADAEQVTACVVAIVRRLNDVDQINFFKDVSYLFCKAAFAAVAGCHVQAWHGEMQAVTEAEPVQARAIVALQLGEDCESIEAAARLTYNQAWKSLSLARAFSKAPKQRAATRVLQFTGGRT
jgi:hypothetical protein